MLKSLCIWLKDGVETGYCCFNSASMNVSGKLEQINVLVAYCLWGKLVFTWKCWSASKLGMLIYPRSCSQAFYSQVFSTCDCLSSLVIKMPVLLGLVIIISENERIRRLTLHGYLNQFEADVSLAWKRWLRIPPAHMSDFSDMYPMCMGQERSLCDVLDLGCRDLCSLSCTLRVAGKCWVFRYLDNTIKNQYQLTSVK